MRELFKKALERIEQNLDKLPLTADVLRAYQIATDPNYDEYQREVNIIALLRLIEEKSE